MSGRLRGMLRACWLPLATRAAKSYLAGPALADALRTCRGLSDQGMGSTIGFWNGDADGPRKVADAHLAALDALSREPLDCYLSVKAPPLEFDRRLLAEVLERARLGGVGVHFDSLGHGDAAATFEWIAGAVPLHSRLGCTLPGRWRRSLRDADTAVELGLSVRVVKGQWADPDPPEVDLREGFLRVIDRLAGRASQVRVATHDPPLAHAALSRLRVTGTPCELELLFGLPARQVIQEADVAGVPVRCYVPYGQAWLPYSISQARRNPRILWWMLRDALAGGPLRPAAVGSRERS